MEATMGKLRNKRGLTLIELIAVIVIIGIIAAIAIPSVGNIISRSKTNADKANQMLNKEAAARYAVETTITDGQVVKVSDLVSSGYLTTAPSTWNDSAKHAVLSVKYTVSGTSVVPSLRSTEDGSTAVSDDLSR